MRQGPGGCTSEGLQEPRERALTWPREAKSKITSPTALQGLGQAHVGLLAPGAAKLGTQGHGYFWASLATRHSPPAPPKSQGKRGSQGQRGRSLPPGHTVKGPEVPQRFGGPARGPALLPFLTEPSPFQNAHPVLLAGLLHIDPISVYGPSRWFKP